eukprot:9336708-Alexandrium_andersonii.AAC.1
MSTPMPGQEPELSPTGPLIFPDDLAELVRRTHLEPILSEIIFPGSTGDVPAARKDNTMATKVDKLA